MKLKKIASLALAGIMAVSMLAGCGDNANGGNNNNGGETNTATGVAAAFNEAQIAGNAVKVEFTNDSAFDGYLAAAVKRAGKGAQNNAVMALLVAESGVLPDTDVVTDFWDESTPSKDLNDGMKQVYLNVEKVDSTTALNEAAAIKYMANEVNKVAADLKADNYDKGNMGVGSTYYKYSYAGKASLVSVVNDNGTTDYYFAIMVTQTAAKTKK